MFAAGASRHGNFNGGVRASLDMAKRSAGGRRRQWRSVSRQRVAWHQACVALWRRTTRARSESYDGGGASNAALVHRGGMALALAAQAAQTHSWRAAAAARAHREKRNVARIGA